MKRMYALRFHVPEEPEPALLLPFESWSEARLFRAGFLRAMGSDLERLEVECALTRRGAEFALTWQFFCRAWDLDSTARLDISEYVQ